MKKLSVTLMFLLSITLAKAQQSNQNLIDSLRKELTVAKEDTNKVHLLSALSAYYSQSSPDTGIAYATQALDLSKKLKSDQGMLEAEGSLAVCLITSGNYPLGLDHAFKTLALAKKNNPSAVPWATSLVSWCNYYLGDYKTALKYVSESFKLAQPWELPYGWRDLAMVYHKLNLPDSALLYGRKAYENLRGSDGEGNIAHILGDAYAGKSNFDSALFYYRNGVSASVKNLLQPDLIDSYNGIAGVYKAKENFDSAVWYSKKVLAEEIEKKYPIGLLKAANMLADIYGSQNKPDSTLKYLRIALNVKDSLFSREKTMAVQNVAFKETEKQKEIEAAKLQSQNRLKMYLLLGGLFTLLAIAGLLFRSNRQKQKANTKIEKAYSELKSTQSQLIQSEKMASLGELTAGIAHEIQNPLNFVNNFSEVNSELIAEMKEALTRGNVDEANTIADDIDENEQKIIFHGKRADAIVKGMLQHSRDNSGQKELTDINKLADEYLRLAYHGLRAKDKSFNATIKTDFDESIGNINIVPQDIGRVILNLINNAFYAVDEKKKNPYPLKGGEDYEPTVTVTTKKLDSPLWDGGKVLISVKDNGNGISQKVIDKIFQPFFTTKPTGQGTGLGLSLAYDIIKAHGGELKVETREGEGAVFIIYLPVKEAT